MVKSLGSGFIHPFIHSFFFPPHIPKCPIAIMQWAVNITMNRSCGLLPHSAFSLVEGTGRHVNKEIQTHIPGAITYQLCGSGQMTVTSLNLYFLICN